MKQKPILLCALLAALLLAGCAPASDAPAGGGSDTAGASASGSAAQGLAACLDDGVYERMCTEPQGADPLYVPFFNREVVCVLGYNGLVLFDSQTGSVRAGIDVQRLGFGDTQGDNAMVVRGNDQVVTISTVAGQATYAYDLAANSLTEVQDPDSLTCTSVTALDAETMQTLGLPADSPYVSALQSPDGVLVCTIPDGDLTRISFTRYDDLDAAAQAS